MVAEKSSGETPPIISGEKFDIKPKNNSSVSINESSEISSSANEKIVSEVPKTNISSDKSVFNEPSTISHSNESVF